MEEEGLEGPIKCIFLCKFHPELGPVIVCQYPENYIANKVFEAIHNYLISKLQIKKRTITVSVFGLKVSGYPNEIKNTKYLRNAFIFNLCFVCDSKSRSVQYEPVVKKLSEYLENLELENGFLSSEESKEKLPCMLAQILEDMNEKGKCTVKITLQNQPISERRMSCRSEKKPEIDFGKPHGGKQERRYSLFSDRKKIEPPSKVTKKSFDINENKDKPDASSQGENNPYVSVLNLKVSSDRAGAAVASAVLEDYGIITTTDKMNQVVGIRSDPIQVQDQHVPILVCSRSTSRAIHQWDLTTQKILPCVDGLSHIAKIAAEADVHNNLVKACVQNLVYYRVVKLLPIFQYNNVYTTLPGLHKLYTTREIQEECLRSVSKNMVRLPTLANVMQMYSSLTYGVSVRDLCLRFKPQTLNIDERKLIQYGLLHGFIHRLHQYPILITVRGNEEPQMTSSGSFHRMCNGLHSLDEICCKFGMTYQEVFDRLERDPNVVVILK